MLYADDAKVYGHFSLSEINEGISLMQQNAQLGFDWARLNGLELNVKKTKATIFGRAQNLAMLPCNLPRLMISGSPIPYVEQVKNLGSLMTPNLNWQPQI